MGRGGGAGRSAAMAEAMADPEVQRMLQDPEVMMKLQAAMSSTRFLHLSTFYLRLDIIVHTWAQTNPTKTHSRTQVLNKKPTLNWISCTKRIKREDGIPHSSIFSEISFCESNPKQGEGVLIEYLCPFKCVVGFVSLKCKLSSNWGLIWFFLIDPSMLQSMMMDPKVGPVLRKLMGGAQ
jgi:hypothetical protein